MMETEESKSSGDEEKKRKFVKDILFNNSDKIDEEEYDIKEIRNNYKNFLDKKESEEVTVSEDEVNFLYNQFTNFATLQLLFMMSRQMYQNEKESDKFLNEFVDNFMSQLKTNFFRGLELSELKQETGIMSKIFTKSILDRGNDYSKKKVIALFSTFETEIKKTLSINKTPPSEEEFDGDLF